MIRKLWTPRNCPKTTALAIDIIVKKLMASEWMLWIHSNFHSPELDPYHVENFRLNFALDK